MSAAVVAVIVYNCHVWRVACLTMLFSIPKLMPLFVKIVMLACDQEGSL